MNKPYHSPWMDEEIPKNFGFQERFDDKSIRVTRRYDGKEN